MQPSKWPVSSPRGSGAAWSAAGTGWPSAPLLPSVEDEEAGYMGLPFNQQESADEWIDAVNWDEIDPVEIN